MAEYFDYERVSQIDTTGKYLISPDPSFDPGEQVLLPQWQDLSNPAKGVEGRPPHWREIISRGLQTGPGLVVRMEYSMSRHGYYRYLWDGRQEGLLAVQTADNQVRDHTDLELHGPLRTDGTTWRTLILQDRYMHPTGRGAVRSDWDRPIPRGWMRFNVASRRYDDGSGRHPEDYPRIWKAGITVAGTDAGQLVQRGIDSINREVTTNNWPLWRITDRPHPRLG